MHPRVWEASGHVAGFVDPLVDCTDVQGPLPRRQARGRAAARRSRAKQPGRAHDVPAHRAAPVQPHVQDVHGPGRGDARRVVYLRPETAQGIFVNFLNVQQCDAAEGAVRHRADRQGVPQRDHARELHLPHARVRADGDAVLRRAGHRRWSGSSTGRRSAWQWHRALGLSPDAAAVPPARRERARALRARRVRHRVRLRRHARLPGDRGRCTTAATSTSARHQEFSGKKLEYFDQPNNKRYVPFVIETSVGADRVTLAALVNAYREEAVEGEDEGRVVLGLHPSLAPIKAGDLPAREEGRHAGDGAHASPSELRRAFPGVLRRDGRASAGATAGRTRSGTPFCITVDGESTKDGTGDGARPRHAEAGARRRRRASRTISRSACRDEPPAVDRAAAPRRRGVHGGALARVLPRARGAQGVGGAAADLREVRAPSLAETRSSSRASVSARAPRGARSAARRDCCSTGRSESQSVARARRARRARDRVGGRRGRAASPTAARSRTSARRSRWRTAPTAPSALHDRRGAQRAGGSASSRRCGASGSSASATSPSRSSWPTATTRRSGAAERRRRSRALRDECAAFLRDTQAMWDEVLPAFAEARARHHAARGDARRRARAVPRARVRRSTSRRATMERVHPPAGARDGHRPDGGRPRAATTRASGRGSGRARSARRCACPTRCTSCCVRTAGRPTGSTFLHELGHALHFAYMRAGPSDRVPLAGRQLGHRRRTRCCSTT